MSIKKFLPKVFSVLAILAMTFSNIQPSIARAQSGDGLKRQFNAESHKVSFIGPASGRMLPASKALGTSIRPQDPAMALAKRYAHEFGLKNPARDLSVMKNKHENNGRATVRYQQKYNNIPVMGGELIVNTDDEGNLYSMNGEVSPDLSLDTKPTITAKQAREAALQSMAKWYQKASQDFTATEPALWIFDESLLQPSTRPVELVWRMEVTPKDASIPMRELVLVNAQTGGISFHFNQIDTAWSGSKQDDVPATPTAEPPQPTETPLPVDSSGLISSSRPTTETAQSSQQTSDQDVTALGTTWYVATTGNDLYDCATPSTPCVTINSALNKAADGDLIKVGVGLYIGSDGPVVQISKNITISGGWNNSFQSQTGFSTIDGQSARIGIWVSNSNAAIQVSLEDLVVQNGTYGILNYETLNINNSSVLNNHTGGLYDDGAGISNYGNTTITNSLVKSNVASTTGSGGGIFNGPGTLTITTSTISENTAARGAGIYNESGALTINNSSIDANNASINSYIGGSYGGGIYNRSGILTLNNSTVTRNISLSGAGIYNGNYNSGSSFNNTTISNNTATSLGGGIYNTGSVLFRNSILGGNTAGTGPDCSGAPSSNGNNIISNITGCTVSATTGDKFNVNPNLGTFLPMLGFQPLLPGSPAINAGNPATCLPTDQRGASRVGACDIGAYEYTTPGTVTSLLVVSGNAQRTAPNTTFPKPLVAVAVDNQRTPVSNVGILFAAPGSGASGTFANTGTYTTYVTTDAGGVATTSFFTANNLGGAYTVTATANGSVSVNFGLENGALFVSPSGSDTNSCTMPNLACATLNAAIGKAIAGDYIFVAVGTYSSMSINKSVSVSGGVEFNIC